jgi:outer membrane receptor for ferric coprogen and ferric-rhodotorulic acid
MSSVSKIARGALVKSAGILIIIVDNVLNKRFFTGSYDQYFVLPGAPRNARVTMGWAF